ncbi:MAG: dihydroorotase [Candidatus Omnitrophota bacterium]|jgi:dihydroorotase
MSDKGPKNKKNLIIRNAHIVDPFHKTDEVLDLQLKDKKIVQIGKGLEDPEAETLDAKGLHLLPGLIDLHVHFREPGYEQKETIETGCEAAIAGGFSACVVMPNTKPACDNAQMVKYQIERGKSCGFNLFPAGALTQGREGKKISEMAEMKAAGAVAVTDDGDWLQDSGVARRVYEYAATYDLVVMSHAEDKNLSQNGVMNEGVVSTRLGLRGRPNASEDAATSRDIELARLTGCRLHLCHVSTAGAVEMIRRAKADGLKITSEATPHHIRLIDAIFQSYDTNYKMNPPLRTESDRLAVIRGLEDGTIDAIATDHAPHAVEEKDQDIEVAPNGVIGLESSLAVVLTELYHGRKWNLADIVRKMSLGPSDIIGKPQFGRLTRGELANFILVDIQREWVFGVEAIRSKSRNSCFLGEKLKGRVMMSVLNGKFYELCGEISLKG